VSPIETPSAHEVASEPRGRERAHAHHRVGEHVERQERLGRAHEPRPERQRKQERGRKQRDDRRRQPRIARAAPGERKHQRHRRDHHQRGARQVERMPAAVRRQKLERVVDHCHGEQAERHVEPEDPRPRQVVRDQPAQHRPRDAGEDPRRAHVGLVLAALARRDDVRDRGLRQRKNPAAAQSLQRAAGDQRRHVGRERAQHRADAEQRQRGQHHAAPPVDVGELAVERRHRGRGQQERGDDEREVFEVAEVAADGRERRRDDGLVHRREERRQHQAEEDGADFRLRQPARDRRRDRNVHVRVRAVRRLGVMLAVALAVVAVAHGARGCRCVTGHPIAPRAAARNGVQCAGVMCRAAD
jgi:hypothetical protein